MTNMVTIDGPTSSGKNSVGFLLAKKLGYQYIDTGMIYRAGSYLVLKNNVSLDDIEGIIAVFRNLNINIRSDEDGLRISNNGEDLTDFIHSGPVTKNVPVIAAIKGVREATKVLQRELGEVRDSVMTGRDIGSEIFPDAKCKFFLTATPEVRAQRRYEQLKKDPGITYQQVYQSILDRDEKDTNREISPLRIPVGAVVIDNSNLTVEQTVDKILNLCTN